MKYIEFPELARLSQALTHEGPECSVLTRIEAYSCKNINRDKKLFRALEHAYNEEPAAFGVFRIGPRGRTNTLRTHGQACVAEDSLPSHSNIKHRFSRYALSSVSTTLVSIQPGPLALYGLIAYYVTKASGNKIPSLADLEPQLGHLESLETVYLEGNPVQAPEGSSYRRKTVLALPS